MVVVLWLHILSIAALTSPLEKFEVVFGLRRISLREGSNNTPLLAVFQCERGNTRLALLPTCLAVAGQYSLGRWTGQKVTFSLQT